MAEENTLGNLVDIKVYAVQFQVNGIWITDSLFWRESEAEKEYARKVKYSGMRETDIRITTKTVFAKYSGPDLGGDS
jgi:hypothetical protein